MAIVSAFGRVSRVVVPDKGVRFNQYWEADVPSEVETSVFSWALPSAPGTLPAYVNWLHITGRINCVVTLKRDGSVLYRGRMDLVRCNLSEPFADCEFVASPGQTLQVFVEHQHATSLTFCGNLGGFRR